MMDCMFTRPSVKFPIVIGSSQRRDHDLELVESKEKKKEKKKKKKKIVEKYQEDDDDEQDEQDKETDAKRLQNSKLNLVGRMNRLNDHLNDADDQIDSSKEQSDEYDDNSNNDNDQVHEQVKNIHPNRYGYSSYVHNRPNHPRLSDFYHNQQEIQQVTREIRGMQERRNKKHNYNRLLYDATPPNQLIVPPRANFHPYTQNFENQNNTSERSYENRFNRIPKILVNNQEIQRKGKLVTEGNQRMININLNNFFKEKH